MCGSELLRRIRERAVLVASGAPAIVTTSSHAGPLHEQGRCGTGLLVLALVAGWDLGWTPAAVGGRVRPWRSLGCQWRSGHMSR